MVPGLGIPGRAGIIPPKIGRPPMGDPPVTSVVPGVGMAEATLANAAAARRMDRKESILYKRMWVGLTSMGRTERELQKATRCRMRKEIEQEGKGLYTSSGIRSESSSKVSLFIFFFQE
jgi:hypothetical protein